MRRLAALAGILSLVLCSPPTLAAGPTANGQTPGKEALQMSTITLTRADDGGTVDARVGDAVAVRLEENPTTGFKWALEPAGDDVLTPDGSDYVRSPNSAVGGGGERVFTFKAAKAGSTTIRLKLWRAWEGEKSTTSTFTVTVRVSA
jgi:inhibitor of cysteine peptidase